MKSEKRERKEMKCKREMKTGKNENEKIWEEEEVNERKWNKKEKC